jgi:phenylpropionate dioxygenase-like ring-hydroxylating dioxygenase large terminal subunit
MQIGIPSINYASSEIFLREVNKIFKENWIFFGFKSDFSSEKLFIDKFIAGIPVFVSNIDGSLFAYYNICPHRGSPLVINEKAIGNKKTVVCPYHHWGFSISEGNSSINKEDLIAKGNACTSLKKIKVDSVGNFIFLNLSDSNRQSLSDFLGEFINDILLASEILDFNILANRQIHHNCNWKHLIENVIDNKHCAPVHKLTLANMGFCKNKPQTFISNLHSMFTINPAIPETSKKRQKLLKLIYKDVETVDYYKHILIFPNLTLSIFEGVHYTIGEVDPVNQGSCVYHTSYLRPYINDKNLSQSIEKNHIDTAIDIFNEDIKMLNSLSDNLFKAGFNGEVYEDEIRIVHFMQNYINQIDQ